MRLWQETQRIVQDKYQVVSAKIRAIYCDPSSKREGNVLSKNEADQ